MLYKMLLPENVVSAPLEGITMFFMKQTNKHEILNEQRFLQRSVLGLQLTL